MTILLCFLFLTTLWKLRCSGRGFHTDFLSKESTCAVNGIFVMFVFLRHFSQYISYGRFDMGFAWLDRRLGQLIVVPFLFYSGYGIGCSILKKGAAYVRQIPRQRFFRVWSHFALALLPFLLLRPLLGYRDSLQTILLSFTGWTSVGNSNWYVFAVLLLYLFTYLAFRIFGKHTGWALAGVTALCCGYILVLRPIKSHWWYDTILAYPAGIALAMLRNHIPHRPKNRAYVPAVGAVLLLMAVAWHFRKNIWAYEGLVILFALAIVLVTEKFRFGNPILAFLGKYTFEIYILQRIPMLLLEKWMPTTGMWKAPYFLLSLSGTLLLAILFRKITDFLDAALLSRKNAASAQHSTRR